MNEQAIGLGQVAYEAYCEARHWKAFNGQPLPSWSGQDQGLQDAWETAAQAVKHAVYKE